MVNIIRQSKQPLNIDKYYAVLTQYYGTAYIVHFFVIYTLCRGEQYTVLSICQQISGIRF